MLAAHNVVRGRAGVAPLTWSDRLAAHSQEWADTLWARKQFFHRPNSTYGENLFEVTGAIASPAQVVSAWAAESRNYDYSSNRCRGVCGHYTQIVWSTTTGVGCAQTNCTTGSPFGTFSNGDWTYSVCDFSPPGNYVGESPY